MSQQRNKLQKIVNSDPRNLAVVSGIGPEGVHPLIADATMLRKDQSVTIQQSQHL
jgi:hypothetical protein